MQAHDPVTHVRALTRSDAAACDAIIASLPGWFGVEEGIIECARAVRAQAGLVCETAGEVIGFLTVIRPRPLSAQISWLAVHAAHRGRGVGTALVERLAHDLTAEGVHVLFVETLSDREDPGPGYAATRAFYSARGFVPAAELDLYPDNPIQLMSRILDAEPSRSVDDLLADARLDAERLSPADAHRELARGDAILVDHRTFEQRTEHGDIPGATRLSMTVLPWRLDPASPWKLPSVIDHDTRVIVLCQEGYSSSLSAAWLRDLGMRRVADVDGGFEAWRDAGLPVARVNEG
jgi:rhodanese-related sulfurtransferase/ribosomal protein S18 acetylase RimI-like enzyme